MLQRKRRKRIEPESLRKSSSRPSSRILRSNSSRRKSGSKSGSSSWLRRKTRWTFKISMQMMALICKKTSRQRAQTISNLEVAQAELTPISHLGARSRRDHSFTQPPLWLTITNQQSKSLALWKERLVVTLRRTSTTCQMRWRLTASHWVSIDTTWSLLKRQATETSLRQQELSQIKTQAKTLRCLMMLMAATVKWWTESLQTHLT